MFECSKHCFERFWHFTSHIEQKHIGLNSTYEASKYDISNFMLFQAISLKICENLIFSTYLWGPFQYLSMPDFFGDIELDVYKGFYRKAFSIWVIIFENFDHMYTVRPHFSPEALFSPPSLQSSTTFGVVRWSKNRFFKIVLESLLNVRYRCWGPN